MGNHDENYGKYGAMGSDEYKKLTRSLEVADDNRKHLEKEVHDLRILVRRNLLKVFSQFRHSTSLLYFNLI